MTTARWWSHRPFSHILWVCTTDSPQDFVEFQRWSKRHVRTVTGLTVVASLLLLTLILSPIITGLLPLMIAGPLFIVLAVATSYLCLQVFSMEIPANVRKLNLTLLPVSDQVAFGDSLGKMLRDDMKGELPLRVSLSTRDSLFELYSSLVPHADL